MQKPFQQIDHNLTNSLVIVIPAYNPNSKLTGIVDNFLDLGFEITLVNDGSSQAHDATFAQLEGKPNLHLLSHEVNSGKGAALKTALAFFKEKFGANKKGFITVDADGQHSVKDVIKVGQKFLQTPNKIIIGSRKLNSKVPLRSKFGNIVTRGIFFLICGKYIYDTQSGLRAINAGLIDNMLQVTTNRYEFELEILIMAKKLGIEVEEVEIQTIYENNNESSHFNPLLDSLKIYFVFFRFLCNSLLTAAVDYTGFAIMHSITGHIALSFVFARLVACSYNFYANKHHVFKDYSNRRKQAWQYMSLVAVLMGAAYYGVLLLTSKGVNVYLAKIITEGSLFFVSFLAQRMWVFKEAYSAKLQTNR